MHAIKGGWIGQTFALAKCNDSGGKTSRIRRSKEERKALVESFIKKYQKLNNGAFPSLNRTHKEVGGSFYTIRELLREAIQENRVLGPAKLTSEDQSLDRFLEQSPLGSISVEPEAGLSPSPNSDQEKNEELVLDASVHCPESEYHKFNEGKIVNGSSKVVEENKEYTKAIYTGSRPKETLEFKANVTHPHQDTSEELVLDSRMECPESEHQTFDEGKSINRSSQVAENTEEYGKTLYTESRPMEALELNENVAELEASEAKATHVAKAIIVETCPITSGSKISYGLDEQKSELTRTLVEEEIDGVETEEVNNISVVDDMNLIKRASELDENVTELEASEAKVTHVAKAVIAETFPITSGSKISYGLDEQKSDHIDLTRTLVEEEIDGVETEEVNNISVVDDMNLIEHASELDENVAELEASEAKITHVAKAVIVETFPITPSSKISYGLDKQKSDHIDLARTLVEEEIDGVETEEVNNISVVDDMDLIERAFDLGNGKAVSNVTGPLVEQSCGLLDEKPVDTLEVPELDNINDSSHSTAKEGTILDTRNGRDAGVEDALPAGTKVVKDAPVGIDITSTSSEQSIPGKEIANKVNPNPKPIVENGSISPKGSNPTLDRMNIESWETTSKKPPEPETNPLLVFIRSVFGAVLKLLFE